MLNGALRQKLDGKVHPNRFSLWRISTVAFRTAFKRE
jgi:hypothetical protein